MVLPMEGSACGGPYCSTLASAPGRPPSGLGFECAGVDSVVELAGIWPNVAAQRLGLPLVGRGRPRR